MAGGAVVTHFVVGNFGGRPTYALDLDELFIKMGNAERRALIAQARTVASPILDELERMIRDGLTEAAHADGDPAPSFVRRANLLLVTANGAEAP